MQVSLLQCQSGQDVRANLNFINEQLNQLKVTTRPHLVVLPECCLLFGGHESQQLAYACTDEHSELKQELAAMAAAFGIYLVAGTIPILAGDGRIYSRSYLFDDQGQTLGHYDKLHLFDVDIKDSTKSYRESDTFCPGERVSVVDTPFGKVGMAICYDLRFADLFRAMRLQGADIIVLPAAFTRVTGKAHWQPLLQARAIENQCFVLAAAQWGIHNEGRRETWGHSSIIGPWGEVIAQKPEQCGWLTSSIDISETVEIRKGIPVVEHNRFSDPKLS
ncbi:carbon-nitrogen hydrolase family protein [Shewanella sp. Isolate11]|uniref:carbon-nitrogen hydrolase family protein n=1 Tax=Shewanella sp. Isolate11 TaxID=2908530 RepID=UPI001EFCA860|nr:carbon-nitrogen hydrolase family protein [Shewanella sp. Isolate11]MCG9695496.1 carbon-nitrogen hydrolase family protein [Shewanella sp. Isolate11]